MKLRLWRQKHRFISQGSPDRNPGLLSHNKEEIMAGTQYDVNSFIRNYTLKDYGKSGAPPGTVLDCSLGVNPDPIPATVLSELGKIT